MGGGTAACAVRVGRLQLVNLFIGFPHPLVIKALLVRGQHLEEAEKFARVFLLALTNSSWVSFRSSFRPLNAFVNSGMQMGPDT